MVLDDDSFPNRDPNKVDIQENGMKQLSIKEKWYEVLLVCMQWRIEVEARVKGEVEKEK